MNDTDDDDGALRGAQGIVNGALLGFALWLCVLILWGCGLNMVSGAVVTYIICFAVWLIWGWNGRKD